MENRVMPQPTLIAQPTPNSCGQTVLAMALGVSVDDIMNKVGHLNVTYPKDYQWVLDCYGYEVPKDYVKVDNRTRYTIPDHAIVRINKIGCKRGHALLYHYGVFYDPGSGGRMFTRETLKEYYPKWRIYGYMPIKLKEVAHVG